VLKTIARLAVFHLLGRERYECVMFRLKAGYWPNLRQPTSFNEKVCYRKLYGSVETATTLSDKWAGRRFVEARAGEQYLNQVYAVVDNPAKLDLAALPDAFVARATHTSGSTLIVRNRVGFDETAFRAKLGRMLAERFGARTNEWFYLNIKPQIVVEKFLVDEANDVPPDYKFYVFDGMVKCIQVDLARFTGHTRIFYDRDWRVQPFGVNYPLARSVERPAALDEMIEVAEKIAAGYDFLRVDLYSPNNRGVVFGELTWTPEAGWGRFTPSFEYDFRLGREWRLAI